jgi:hypothetical protein
VTPATVSSHASPCGLSLPLLLGLSAAKLLLHLGLAGRHGYFRDELYFLDCGRHLDWGYVDHAPMIALLARLALLLGASLPVLRAFPAVAGALLVALTILLTWRLGGGRFAQALAGLAVIAAPLDLAMDSLFTMNALEPLFWIGCLYLLVRIRDTGDSRLWLGIGALMGLGLMNKHSMAFFGVALLAGVLATPLRRELRKPWPWLAGGLALLIFVPNVVWQLRHDFATLEDLRNVQRIGKNVVLSPVAFVAQQIVLLHPALAPLWLGGLAYLLMGGGGRHRALGWSYLMLLGLFIALKGKNYYLGPIYALLFAAGAVAFEGLLDRAGPTRGRAWPRAASLGYVVVAGTVTAPLALPLLPPEKYVAYERFLGFEPPKTEVAHRGPLPQALGDQFGWPELVAEVAAIYYALPPAERAGASIFAGNYGEAGAINLFGPRYGLPRAISGHQTYFLWGPGDATGDVTIVLQANRADLERVCTSVVQAGEHHHPWGMAEENGPIFVCRGLKTPLRELWPRVKNWN